jgi:hypothetical protein
MDGAVAIFDGVSGVEVDNYYFLIELNLILNNKTEKFILK